MIGALIYILCAGAIMLMGVAYTAVMAYLVLRRILRPLKRLWRYLTGYRRVQYIPTESMDKVEGNE